MILFKDDMYSGLIEFPWWGYVVTALVLTHITIAAVTIFLHRHQAHRALDLHPLPSHFFRFWLWLTTGMVTKEWAAVHRKHHAKVETEEDPHSPQILGINKILWAGVGPYRVAANDKELVEKYGTGTPDDWLERHLYAKHPILGIGETEYGLVFCRMKNFLAHMHRVVAALAQTLGQERRERVVNQEFQGSASGSSRSRTASAA